MHTLPRCKISTADKNRIIDHLEIDLMAEKTLQSTNSGMQ